MLFKIFKATMSFRNYDSSIITTEVGVLILSPAGYVATLGKLFTSFESQSPQP